MQPLEYKLKENLIIDKVIYVTDGKAGHSLPYPSIAFYFNHSYTYFYYKHFQKVVSACIW